VQTVSRRKLRKINLPKLPDMSIEDEMRMQQVTCVTTCA
jgi:hypothetical protein